LCAPGKPAGSAKIGLWVPWGLEGRFRALGRARPCGRTRGRSARARLRSVAKRIEVAVRARADVSGNRGQLSAAPSACQAIFSSSDRVRPDFAVRVTTLIARFPRRWSTTGLCQCLASTHLKGRDPFPPCGGRWPAEPAG
jgi:hypothetical protein